MLGCRHRKERIRTSSASWNAAFQKVTDLLRAKAADGHMLWFRGHRDAKWPLTSTLHRHVVDQVKKGGRDLPPDAETRVHLLRELGKTLYYKFRAKGWPLLRGRERSPWGIVFSMQHHGVPTRLLDWTESFACALYFAQQRRSREDSAALFVLDPEILNAVGCGSEGLVAVPDDFLEKVVPDLKPYHPKWGLDKSGSLPTLAVGPFLSNPRMIAQKAAFILVGDSFDSIEQQLKGRDDVLWKIELPPETYDDVDDFLRAAGASPFTYYPDLPGLAAEIMRGPR